MVQGAERPIHWDEISRFKKLPFVVCFRDAEDGKEHKSVFEVQDLDLEARTVVWRLANIHANSPGEPCTVRVLSGTLL
jgi:hypothetical protein